MCAPSSATRFAPPAVTLGPQGSNSLTDYLRAILDDHHVHDCRRPAGTTWEDHRQGTARHLWAIRRDYKPLVREALQKNALRPKRERQTPRMVKAEEMNRLRARAQRAWEEGNYVENIRRERDLADKTDLRTPFIIAIPYLVRSIDIPGISEQQIREFLAELPWGGQLERTPLVAELERLDREGYAKRLAEIIALECPNDAARVELNCEPGRRKQDRTPDSKEDKRQILPKDNTTRAAIRYVKAHRRKVLDGTALPMSLHDLLAEFSGNKGAKAVARLERALRPSRWGHLLKPDKLPDK